ncbi:hypothetical protein CYANOKiyG1_01550 [Okeania sp. KiyG1]|nr:hypothetical protein CYANOKiyG1_01550 [Okeania sp. KiyG1]
MGKLVTQETSLKGFLYKISKMLPKLSFPPYLIEGGIVKMKIMGDKYMSRKLIYLYFSSQS